MKTKIIEMMDQLNDLPNQISTLQLNLIDLNLTLKSLNSNLVDVTAEIKETIHNQLDDNGKKLYSNGESRENAFILESKSNPEYCELTQKILELTIQIQKITIEIEKLQNQQRNYRILITQLANFPD